MSTVMDCSNLFKLLIRRLTPAEWEKGAVTAGPCQSAVRGALGTAFSALVPACEMEITRASSQLLNAVVQSTVLVK